MRCVSLIASSPCTFYLGPSPQHPAFFLSQGHLFDQGQNLASDSELRYKSFSPLKAYPFRSSAACLNGCDVILTKETYEPSIDREET